MSTPFFKSLSIGELANMFKDKDVFSILLLMIDIIFLVAYFALLILTSKNYPWIFIPFLLTFFGFYFYRAFFIANEEKIKEKREWKKLDKFKGQELEAALERMTDEQRERYIEDLKRERKRCMSKTTLWVGNAIISSFLAAFLAVAKGNPGEISNIIGAMAEAAGCLLGGLFVGWIVNGFIKEATEQRKNFIYYAGVILFTIAAVFGKLFHS